MSFQATPARSSRVTKPKKTSAAAAMGLRRSISSPSSSAASPRRRKTSQPRQKTAPLAPSPRMDDDDDDSSDKKLNDIALIASLSTDPNLRDVPQYMESILRNMFDAVPQRGAAGMSSSRIAEVLSFRASLPPIVTVAHVHALAASHTAAEREMDALAKKGVLRRVAIPLRGVGAADVGDGVVAVGEWVERVEGCLGLGREVKEKYTAILQANPLKTAIPNTSFTPQEIALLTAAGFLTTSTTFSGASHSTSFTSPSLTGPLSSLSTAGSRHAAGSLGAVGGASASSYIPGGAVTATTGAARANQTPVTSYYNFALPNTGSHVKLVTEARTHLVSLLKKTRFREAPMDVLREQWDGGVAVTRGQKEIAERKRARGEAKGSFGGVVGGLAGRSKKWRVFWGLRFEWVLGECVGAGLVEVFETGSVGRGVRLVS